MKNKLILLTLISLIVKILSKVDHCDGRGGCYCDCGWASYATCHDDDGSCCFDCCCNSHPGPSPPSPPTPPPGPVETYCPSAQDITTAYGNPEIVDQGWTVRGGGAAATKAAFNLLGGSVEYDIDFTNVPVGVNANIYTISPSGVSGNGFNQNNYCDGAKPAGNQWCVEVDWIETNGNCGGAITLHDIPGPGNDGCTAWGCRADHRYYGKTSFHMKITYGADGYWTTYIDDKVFNGGSLNPTPRQSDWDILRHYYSQFGAVIYSSQWVGWVPLDECGTNPGNLDAASFSVRNLRITGSVLQGPTPRKCNLKFIE